MFPELTITTVFIITTIVLGAALIVLSHYYQQLVARYRRLQGEEEHIRDRSRKKAQEMVMDAKDTSEHIIHDAKLFSEDLTEEMKQKIAHMTDKQLAEYQKQIQTSQDETIKSVKTVSDDIRNRANSMLQELVKSQATDTNAVRSKLNAFTTTQTQVITQELEQYKREQMNRIDELVAARVRAVVERVLPESLTRSDHEALVKRALEKVKDKSQ